MFNYVDDKEKELIESLHIDEWVSGLFFSRFFKLFNINNTNINT